MGIYERHIELYAYTDYLQYEMCWVSIKFVLQNMCINGAKQFPVKLSIHMFFTINYNLDVSKHD